MSYAVRILRRAQAELEQLPDEAYERVRDAVRALGEDPRPSGCAMVIYEVDDPARIVTVLHIGHHRDVYR